MSERIKRLYPEPIKALNEQPYHFEKMERTPSVSAYNPICGDRFELYIESGNGTIGTIHFYGFGCAISKASTSILTKSMEGKTYDEALALCDNFLQYINNTLTGNQSVLNEEFKYFSAIHEFPERHECASLAWTEMRKYLESKTNK